MDERHTVIFIIKIKNNAPKSVNASFIKLPLDVDLGFYSERYANDIPEEAVISDIFKRLGIEKNQIII